MAPPGPPRSLRSTARNYPASAAAGSATSFDGNDAGIEGREHVAMTLGWIIVPILDWAYRLPFKHAVRIIDRKPELAAGSHDRAEGAEAVCSSRLHRDRD